MLFLLVFFFQAEDGIRDTSVTGVQTCALPIFTAEAARIGTFETSIIPDQDCCTLFTPRHPATRAERSGVAALEARLDVTGLVAQAVAATERVRLRAAGEHDEERTHGGAPEPRVQPLA